MSTTIAYLRASTDKQDLNNQKVEIYDYARKHNLNIDEFVEIIISARKSEQKRLITDLLERLKANDTLIVTELSRVGRTMSEVISIVNKLMQKKVRLIAVKQNLNLTEYDMNSKVIIYTFALMAELDLDLISARVKQALAAKKAQGIHIGKPKGTIQKSKFDEHVDKIKELLHMGLSVRKICRYLNFKNHISLNNYIVKRKLRDNLPKTYCKN